MHAIGMGAREPARTRSATFMRVSLAFQGSLSLRFYDSTAVGVVMAKMTRGGAIVTNVAVAMLVIGG